MVVQSIANIKQGKCQHKYQLCQPKKIKKKQLIITNLEALYLREERGKEQKNNINSSQVLV